MERSERETASTMRQLPMTASVAASRQNTQNSNGRGNDCVASQGITSTERPPCVSKTTDNGPTPRAVRSFCNAFEHGFATMRIATQSQRNAVVMRVHSALPDQIRNRGDAIWA